MAPQPIRVVLVEDDPDDAKIVNELLAEIERRSFKVEWVRSLQACQAYLKDGAVDVILSDLNLPDSQGLETFTRLHAQAPMTPVVILTGTYEEEELALQAVQQGAQDYLVKGQVDGKLLSRVLLYAIERQRVEEKLRAANEDLTHKIKNINWLNQIMMDREEQLIKLKHENQLLRRRVGGHAPDAGLHDITARG